MTFDRFTNMLDEIIRQSPKELELNAIAVSSIDAECVGEDFEWRGYKIMKCDYLQRDIFIICYDDYTAKQIKDIQDTMRKFQLFNQICAN